MKKLFTFLAGILAAIAGFIAFNKTPKRPKTDRELELDKKENKLKKRLAQIEQEIEKVNTEVNKDEMTDEEWKSYWKKQ